jgi:GDP-L-fucose synthase
MNLTKTDRIAVTGAGGFLGSFVLEQLASHGYDTVISVRQKDYDLTHEADAERMYADLRPDVVVHLAAEVGGIGANRDNPGRYFFANMAMGLNLIEAARKHGLKKFVQTGTICAYPNLTPVPFKEADLWNGYPEVTNAPYGIAKKSLLVMCQGYRQQYGLNAIYLLPVNLYGPRDNFDLKTSHIIPAIVRKCVEAKERGDAEIVAWGSGNVSREFLYVQDCARGLVLAMEKYNSPEPMNLGNGREVTIRQAIETIAGLVGFTGKVTWDASKPDGQPRRCLDVSRAKREIGFEATISFEDGLRKTVDWYTTHRAEARR